MMIGFQKELQTYIKRNY